MAAKAQAADDGRMIEIGFNSPPHYAPTNQFVTTTLTVNGVVTPIPSLDAIALHPYMAAGASPVTCAAQTGSATAPCPITIPQIESVHNESPLLQIWVTEYGFIDDNDAQGLETALRWMSGQPWLTRAYVHMLHDAKGESYGLLRGEYWNDTGLLCARVAANDRLPLWQRFYQLRRGP